MILCSVLSNYSDFLKLWCILVLYFVKLVKLYSSSAAACKLSDCSKSIFLDFINTFTAEPCHKEKLSQDPSHYQRCYRLYFQGNSWKINLKLFLQNLIHEKKSEKMREMSHNHKIIFIRAHIFSTKSQGIMAASGVMIFL